MDLLKLELENIYVHLYLPAWLRIASILVSNITLCAGRPFAVYFVQIWHLHRSDINTLNCWCGYQPDFLLPREECGLRAAQGCPVVPLVDYLDGYIGLCGLIFGGLGDPGNGKSQVLGALSRRRLGG